MFSHQVPAQVLFGTRQESIGVNKSLNIPGPFVKQSFAIKPREENERSLKSIKAERSQPSRLETVPSSAELVCRWTIQGGRIYGEIIQWICHLKYRKCPGDKAPC